MSKTYMIMIAIVKLISSGKRTATALTIIVCTRSGDQKIKSINFGDYQPIHNYIEYWISSLCIAIINSLLPSICIHYSKRSVLL
jgi:hypothetical protein